MSTGYVRLRIHVHMDSQRYTNSWVLDESVLTDTGFPYWLEEAKRVTPQMFLDKNPAENGGGDNTAANRIRWILKDTMGADGAFDRRKQELAILRSCQKEAVTDEDVVQSYRDECDPAKQEDNFMLQYLEHGLLGYVFGKNLFLHGGLNVTTMGTVPSVNSPGKLSILQGTEIRATGRYPIRRRWKSRYSRG